MTSLNQIIVSFLMFLLNRPPRFWTFWIIWAFWIFWTFWILWILWMIKFCFSKRLKIIIVSLSIRKLLKSLSTELCAFFSYFQRTWNSQLTFRYYQKLFPALFFFAYGFFGPKQIRVRKGAKIFSELSQDHGKWVKNLFSEVRALASQSINVFLPPAPIPALSLWVVDLASSC